MTLAGLAVVGILNTQKQTKQTNKQASGCIFKISFLISQPKHVVGTQKNGLNETLCLD